MEEPDWEKEMELFKERMKSPNQLATLRKLAEVRANNTRWGTHLRLPDKIQSTWRCRDAPRRSRRRTSTLPRSCRPVLHRPLRIRRQELCHRPAQVSFSVFLSQDDVDTGRVLAASNGLAIIEGLNNDAAIGTTLQFFSGASGTLLWRR